MPDTVLEYGNVMVSDKDVGPALLELTGVNQTIPLIQEGACLKLSVVQLHYTRGLQPSQMREAQ